MTDWHLASSCNPLLHNCTEIRRPYGILRCSPSSSAEGFLSHEFLRLAAFILQRPSNPCSKPSTGVSTTSCQHCGHRISCCSGLLRMCISSKLSSSIALQHEEMECWLVMSGVNRILPKHLHLGTTMQQTHGIWCH